MNAVLELSRLAPAEPTTGRLDIDRVSIELGAGAARFTALQDVSVAIRPGEFVCLLGPSGCGKSTLLGALAGHLVPSRGQLLLDGQPIGGPAPERGLVFQHHTLFPWLSVLDNVAYGLRMRGVGRAQRREQAMAWLSEVGLEGFEHHYPAALSGGMQQRVEIARVLINEPRVLLMDEPFGALDALTRLKMQELLLALWARRRMSVVFVTHDIDEALFMADRILVMSARPGRVVEEIVVPAGRPRTADWLTGPAFAACKRHCLALLRDPDLTVPLERLSPLTQPAPADADAAAVYPD
ncbi:ABC transporter ATP-binding protein [Zoogloea sp.]|uniref:ABC transporter ATP-binding protein n=1 Tax=Zoogloea sp. TaxID=49181 RepID=UPI001416D939|nr:MAG: ABC transporter ATP-binding protein [Zoogloea sp.]